MKFLKLELLNLASLDKRDGEVINFEEGVLGESTIFSIVGPTGSGKSTILDAICLALYNRAPRYPRQSGAKDKMEVYGDKDNTEENRLSPSDGRNILSRGKKEGYSKLTFLANNGSVYRAEWSVRFKVRNYDNAITSLYRIVQKDGKPEEEVADWKDLPQIIGLDYDQFLRTVLIAQGSFANFLTATVDERYALLEKLVGCEDIYTRIAEEIKQKKDASIASYHQLKAQFDAFEKDDLTPEQLSALHLQIEELKAMEKKLTQELEAVAKHLEWYAKEEKHLAHIQQYKEALDKAQSALEQMKPQCERLALHDATLQAVGLYREKKSKDEALQQIADALATLRQEVEQKHLAILAEEKTLEALKDEAGKAALRLSEQKPRINAARTLKAQCETAQGYEREKTALRTKAETECAQAKQTFEANDFSVKKYQSALDEIQTASHAYKVQADQQREALKKQEESAAQVYQEAKKQLDEKQMDHLLQAHEQATSCLNELKEAIRIQHEWKQKEQRKLEAEQEEKTLIASHEAFSRELAQLQVVALAEELVVLRQACALLTSEDWERHRHKLEEGKPCPLCGATNHPYQKPEVLEPVVTGMEAQIARKQAELDRQTATEKRLNAELGKNKGNLESLAKTLALLRTDIAKHQSEWNAIAPKHPDWKADEASLHASLQPHEEALQQAKKALDAYRALSAQVEKLRLLKEQESTRLKAHEETADKQLKDLETRKTQAATALASESGKTENLKHQWDEKEKALANALAEQTQAHESVLQKLKELKELTGDKDPEAWERELTEAKEHTEKQVEGKNKQIAGLNQQLANVKGNIQSKETQQKQELEAMQAKERDLSAWLSHYNADESHLRKLTLADIVELSGATDPWEAIRQEKEACIQAHIRAKTTFSNEEKARADHQQGKPSETKENLELRKHELQSKDRSELIAAEAKLQRYLKAKEAMGALHAEKQHTEQVMRDWEAISKAIGGADGKTLRKIAQCYTLRFLIEHANAEIRKFNQRYELVQVKNSLGIRVIDHDRADDIRDTTSLSGGETFIVSLGLALGLSALSSRNISFENLFIDEGFGTLDPDTLSTVIDSLAMLQSSQGKKVGVISHTDTMSERITTQIRIVKNGNSGSSHIEVHP